MVDFFLDLSLELNILRSVLYYNTSSRYIVQILHIIILGHRETLSISSAALGSVKAVSSQKLAQES